MNVAKPSDLLGDVYTLLGQLRHAIRYPLSPPLDLTRRRLVTLGSCMDDLNNFINSGELQKIFGDKMATMLQNHAEMNAFYREFQQQLTGQQLSAHRCIQKLESLYGMAEIVRHSAVDIEMGIGSYKAMTKPPPLDLSTPTPANPDEAFLQKHLGEIYNVIAYLKNIIRHPPLEKNAKKAVTNQRLRDIAANFDQLEALLASERLKFHRRDMAWHLRNNIDGMKERFNALRLKWANGEIDNHSANAYLVDLVQHTEGLRAAVTDMELGFDPTLYRKEMEVRSITRANKPRPLNLSPPEETAMKKHMQAIFRLVEELRNLIRHPPTVEDTPITVTLARCERIGEKLNQITQMVTDHELAKLRREFYKVYNAELQELMKYHADFWTMVRNHQSQPWDNSMYREVLKNMLHLADNLLVEMTNMEMGFDLDINVDMMEADLEGSGGYTSSDDAPRTAAPPPDDRGFETFVREHGGEFGSPDYLNFLRQNIREGSKLALWRESPAKGSTLPPVGNMLTVAPGGLPSPGAPWVGVTVDMWPGRPVTWLDLSSVFLLKPSVAVGLAAPDWYSFQAFSSPQYLDYLARTVNYGSEFLLWRDDQYSGLKAGQQLLIEPAHLAQGSMETVVSVTRKGDPSQKVFKVYLGNACLNLPYHLQVEYLPPQ